MIGKYKKLKYNCIELCCALKPLKEGKSIRFALQGMFRNVEKLCLESLLIRDNWCTFWYLRVSINSC